MIRTISDFIDMAVSRRSEFYPSSSFQQIFPKINTDPNVTVKVIKAQHKVDDLWYAIKQSMVSKEIGELEVLREIRAMANFDHPNIVRYFNSWYSKTDLMINDRDQRQTEINE